MYCEKDFHCERPSRARRVVAPLLFLALLAAGCGKKGDPLPPLRDIPLKTTDLVVRQQGNLILFEMTYPSVTVSGLPLGGIDGVELHQMVKPALADGTAPPADATELESRAEVLLTLRGAELGAAVSGDRLQFRLPLAEELPEEPTAHYFAVRTLKGSESSDFSNLVSLVPMKPPAAPTNLQVVAHPDAIELTWESEAEMQGFAVYRRGAQEKGYGKPIATPAGSARAYRDKAVDYGQRYIYTVRSLASLTPPILSAEAGEREIEYLDRFAPALPANFVVLGERSRVRLRWDASADRDVAGYVLYRREPGRDFHRLNEELITKVEYIDRGLVSGFTYDYRIQAVDGAGNESEVSEPVSAEVR